LDGQILALKTNSLTSPLLFDPLRLHVGVQVTSGLGLLYPNSYALLRSVANVNTLQFSFISMEPNGLLFYAKLSSTITVNTFYFLSIEYQVFNIYIEVFYFYVPGFCLRPRRELMRYFSVCLSICLFICLSACLSVFVCR